MTILVSGLEKSYATRTERVRALAGVDLEVGEAEFVVVVGPSGSGKSTLLRCIAGLETPDAGAIAVAGRDVTQALPGDRNVAMVFQEFALYPHLSVAGNISFGLRARKEPEEEVERRVGEAAAHLGLTDALERFPSELSGGERQRVALARAMVREPSAFLMDEPLSNLDTSLRVRMRREIRDLQRRLTTSTVYVTHDQVEAMTLGDRVAVMRDGRIEQVARPLDLYNDPDNAFVASFLGTPPMNVLPASAAGLSGPGDLVGVRPECLRLAEKGRGRFEGVVAALERVGAEDLIHLDVAGHDLTARVPAGGGPVPGSAAALDALDDDLYWFAGPHGARIR